MDAYIFINRMLLKFLVFTECFLLNYSKLKQGVYTETVNNKIVPKKNALGEDIIEPEHVQVGLNYKIICQEISDTESILRELRRIENDILKILKKRVDK